MRGWPRGALFAVAVLCNVVWGGAYVTGKLAIGTPDVAGFGPFRTAFLRFGAAGLLILCWGLWRAPDKLRLRGEDVPVVVGVGFLGICLTYAFNYTGLKLSTGTAASLIMATEPVWLALLAAVFLRERLGAARGLGIALGLAGSLLVILSTQKPSQTGTGNPAMLGNLLFVGSLLLESGAVLTMKRLTARYPGWVLVCYEFLVGAALLTPFAVWETQRLGVPSPAPAAWASLLYLFLGCSVVAYVAWFTLLEILDASLLSVFIFLQPVLGTALGVFLFRDPFTLVTALGACLVLGGVAFIVRAASPSPDLPVEIAQAAGE